MAYSVKKDNKTLKKFKTQDEADMYLQKIQPFSKHHATTYEGYKVEQEEKAIKQLDKGSYEVNISKVKSDDPLAYSMGYVEGKEGRAISENKNLAPAYVEGFKKGREERGTYIENNRYAGFKTRVEAETYAKEHNLEVTGHGYNDEQKHFFEVKSKEPEYKEFSEKQTIKNPAQSLEYLKEKNPNIAKHNWSFEVADKKLSLTLGNMSDAGWYWSGDEKDLIGYTYRMHQSQIENEFYTEMNRNKISFNQLKPLYLQSAKEKDGLYQISGDNLRWKFGETGYSDEYLLEEENLGMSQREEFYMNYKPITYEEFEKKHGKQYQTDVKQAINSSSSFREFVVKMDDLNVKYKDLANEEDENKARSLISSLRSR